MDHIIEIRNLYKKYRNAEHFSVNDLSIDVDRGEIFGLLGPNGAGKTTLISMLCGLIRPTAGDYRIDGVSYRENQQRIKTIMGLVPQDYALYPSLTAKENLMFFGSLYGLKKDILAKKIEEGLERVGLSEFANRRIEYFSGGMKRRCNLLAGILHNPKILFLDEPTVGVDVHSRNLIMEYLLELNTQGTSILYTSHHLAEAEEFCTHIAIIDHGKIFAKGTPAELISSVEGARNLEDVFISLTGKELRDAV